ncbi:MAG: hypothetical protein NTW50_03885 [Candidatus Berkelbacteria bacterium]|nr:hypothetical protein [Candidatus Berkelbacteria bacterium]
MSEKKVEIGKAIGYGWDSVKKDFWYWVGIALAVCVIEGIGSGGKGHEGLGILGIFLSAWMSSGYNKIILKYYDGKKPEFVELFTQLKYFWRVLGAALLIGLIVMAGLVLLVVPGIFWGLKYMFTVILIIDKDLGIREAMAESAKMTAGIKFPLFGFCLASLGVMILGAIVLYKKLATSK